MQAALQWTGFNLFVLVLLLFDLLTSRSQTGPLTMRSAVLRSIFWILLGLGVNAWVYSVMGPAAGMDFLSAYLLEKALSVDNLFIFLLIFRFFKVPQPAQQRVLLLGVLGALVMRGTLIFAGITLVQAWRPVLYIFAVILIFSGIKMGMSEDDDELEPENNPVVKWMRRHFPVHPAYEGRRFFVQIDGRRLITPLLIVLVALETTDLVFALDSIPAVFGVTQNPFIVYSSNVMAVLGLRALFFALSGLMGMFHYLQRGLSFILVFIGSEMLLEGYVPISTPVELGVITGVLALSVVASKLYPKADDDDDEAPPEGEAPADLDQEPATGLQPS